MVSMVTTTIVLLFALLAVVQTHFEKSTLLFGGLVSLDPMGQFFKILIIGSALVCLILSSRSKDLEGSPRVEFLFFLLALTLGLNIMVVSNNLIMMYLAIEMSSIVSYILAAYISNEKRSEEAGLKYVLYGGIASGVMIFGMSLLYGLTGTLDLIGIREFFLVSPTDRMVLFLAFIMILTGLGYKMAIAPFHMWSPDVYEGAPISITAFLSVASKAAGFAIAMRFLFVAFLWIEKDGTWMVLKVFDWKLLMAILAALTMTVGNVLALQQNNIKRFLAYSSIAHAGYMLMGVAVQSRMGLEAIIFYFMVYFLMNLGAFLVATLVANQFQTEDMLDYRGLAKQNAFGLILSLCLTVFLFSLTGIPPFAGFIGKWYLFKAVIHGNLIWLAVVGGLNAVISLYYYVRLIKYMLVDDPQTEMKIHNTHWRFSSLIILFAFFTVLFGVYFEPLARWAKASAFFFH